ncbi:hypothetical protein G6F42_026069 [Rhizopus arrhizus]|nr:hypothetical protein G6F42_026069 [Rhizopus arrhizus]
MNEAQLLNKPTTSYSASIMSDKKEGSPPVSEEVITEDEHDEENEHLEFGIDRSKQGSSFTAFFRQCGVCGSRYWCSWSALRFSSRWLDWSLHLVS